MGVHRMMTKADQEEISRGIAEQAECRVIVERIGRDPSVSGHRSSRQQGSVSGGGRRPRRSGLPVQTEDPQARGQPGTP